MSASYHRDAGAPENGADPHPTGSGAGVTHATTDPARGPVDESAWAPTGDGTGHPARTVAADPAATNSPRGRPPITTPRAGTSGAATVEHTPWRQRLLRVLLVFALSKLGLIVIGYVTIAAFAPFAEVSGALNWGVYAYGREEQYNLINMWFRWDSMHYFNMVGLDYLRPLTAEDHQQLQAALNGEWLVVNASLHRFTFPPLFPLLAKPLALVIGAAPAMLLVANAAMIGCLWFIDLIAERLFGGREHGRRAMIYLAIFPGAYLLHAALTESLFLFLCLATFHFAWTNRWGLVAVFGFALGLTRSSGFTLALALGLVALSQAGWRFDGAAIRSYLRKAPAIAAPGIAWACFMGWCKAMTGDAFAYSHLQQAGWGITMVPPWQPFIDTLAQDSPDRIEVYKLVFVLLLVALLVLCLRVLPVAYGVAGLAVLLVAMSIGAPWHQSILRYAAVEFPVVLLAVAAAKRWPRLEMIWVAPMIAAQTVMMMLWTLPYTMVII